MRLSKEEIKKIIPHREPFLLVDEIIELNDKDITGLKKIEEDDFYLKGHFPNNPVVPGVLQVEMIAQVGAVMLLQKEEFEGKTAYFTAIKRAKFKDIIRPNDELTIKVSLIKLRNNFGSASGEIYCNEKLVCEAEIAFAVLGES